MKTAPDRDCWIRLPDLKPTLRYVDQTLELQLRRYRHDPDLAAVLAAKRAEVLARYSDMTPTAHLRGARLGGMGAVGAVVPAPRRRLGPVLRSWLKR